MDVSSLRDTSAHVIVADGALRSSGEIPLDDATEHHLRRVLRLRDGERVGVTDGSGGWLIATSRVDGSTVRLEPTTEVSIEAEARSITVAAAMPKGDRLEWMVQKVTELGARRLVLLHAERSVVRWKPARADHARDRLQRIADEACRQSRRTWRLVVEGPFDAASVLGEFVVAEPGGRRLSSDDLAVAVGPEGGWSDVELAAGGDTVSLGRHILRTETAAVAAIALCVALDR